MWYIVEESTISRGSDVSSETSVCGSSSAVGAPCLEIPAQAVAAAPVKHSDALVYMAELPTVDVEPPPSKKQRVLKLMQSDEQQPSSDDADCASS